MKKRLLTTCLSVFFAASGLALGSCGIFGPAAEPEVDTGLAFELVDGTYTLVGRGVCEDGIINVPSKYQGKAVTAIGDKAFENDQYIGILNIPDSVTKIGADAFSGCSNLSEVTMGNGVAEVGSKAFYTCGWLENITFSDSLESIGSSTFYGCRKLKAIDLPDSLKTISNNAFEMCNGLEDVTFGTSLEIIGENAFLDCTSINAIVIPDGAPTEIQVSAFENCGNAQIVTLGNDVKSIGSNAFKGVYMMKQLVIGDGVTSIGATAFQDCSRVYTVTIGASVISIGTNAFYKCRAIREVYNRSTLNIYVDPQMEEELDQFGGIGKNAFYVRTGDEPSKLSVDETQRLIYYIDGARKVVVGCMLEDYTDVVLPDDVTEIATRAFYNVDFVRSIDTGSGCTIIGASAFQNCYHLEKAIIGKSVQTIGNGAFYRNKALVTVVFRTKLENGSVGENAFWKYNRKANGSLEKDSYEYKNLFFEGTREEWTETKAKFALTGKGNSNKDLLDKATIYYYSETAPTSSGNYWHFVDGVATKW